MPCAVVGFCCNRAAAALLLLQLHCYNGCYTLNIQQATVAQLSFAAYSLDFGANGATCRAPPVHRAGGAGGTITVVQLCVALGVFRTCV